MPLKKFCNYFARIFLIKDGKKDEICIPCGFENFKNMLIDRYPEEKKAINRFFSYSKSMFEELSYLKVEPGPFDLLMALVKCPKTVKNSNKTFKEYFQSFGFKNSQLEEIFDVFAAFSGLSANRAAAMMTVATMNTSLNGAFRPMKGFIQLPIKLKDRAQELGCTIQTNAKVNKILVKNHRTYGIQLEDGTVINAQHVITTIDTKVAMEQLIGLDVLEKADKKYANKVKEVKMSASSITISLGLDEDIDLQSLGLDCGYNIITTGKGTFEKLFIAFDQREYMLETV